MAKKTGVRLGLKNLGIESGGEPTGLEDIFGLAPTPETTKPPRRRKRGQSGTEGGDSKPIFGEIDTLAARPDGDQPRTLLPSAAYTAMDQGADPQAVLNDWLSTRHSASPSQQEEMTEIISLADTIETAGLQQPIGIREIDSQLEGVQYAVVFGERRWWAHVYLLSADNIALGQELGKIRAGLVQPSNLQLVQLIENLHRRNLPPLDIAMGLKRSMEELKANGVKNPGQQLEKATGIRREHRSRYIHLLELAPEVQQKIRDFGLTENAVRPIADRLRKADPALQLSAINTLLKWRTNDQPSGPKQLNNEIDRLLVGQDPISQRGPHDSNMGVSTFVNKIISKSKAAGKSLNTLNNDAIEQFRIYLNNEPKTSLSLVNLRNRLNEVLNDTIPGKLFLVQIDGQLLELSAENAAAGYLAFESYLEAAAEEGEVLEYPVEEAQALAADNGMVLWIAGVDGRVSEAV